MSEGIVVGVRRRRSRVEAERLVLEFERSGLSRRAFCAQHGLSVPSLDQYRKRWQDVMSSSAMTKAAANRILPVEFIDASINYEAVTPTEADRQKFRDSILTKYGQPYRKAKAVSALWCNKGVSLGSGPLACAPDVPALQLKGNELIVSDSGLYHREKAAWSAQTTGAPPI